MIAAISDRASLGGATPTSFLLRRCQACSRIVKPIARKDEITRSRRLCCVLSAMARSILRVRGILAVFCTARKERNGMEGDNDRNESEILASLARRLGVLSRVIFRSAIVFRDVRSIKFAKKSVAQKARMLRH